MALDVIADRCLVSLGVKHTLQEKKNPAKNPYLMTRPLLIACYCKQEFNLPNVVLSGAKPETKPCSYKKIFLGDVDNSKRHVREHCQDPSPFLPQGVITPS